MKPLFLFIYIVILRRFVPQPFTFPAEVQFPFVSFDRVLIISSLDSLVFRLGISIYDSLSPFPLRLTRVSSRISTTGTHHLSLPDLKNNEEKDTSQPTEVA